MDKERQVTVSSKRQITLPAEVCEEMGIERGDRLKVVWGPEGIMLRPVPRFQPLTQESCLFRHLGAGESGPGPGAREHDRLLADEARGGR